MGWDVTQVGKNISTKKFLEHDILSTIGANYELLALCEGKNQYGQKPFYAALRNNLDHTVSAVVYLTKRRNGSIAVKSVGENSGPLLFDCPIKILNLLTKTDNAWALQWRADCTNKYISDKFCKESA